MLYVDIVLCICIMCTPVWKNQSINQLVLVKVLSNQYCMIWHRPGLVTILWVHPFMFPSRLVCSVNSVIIGQGGMAVHRYREDESATNGPDLQSSFSKWSMWKVVKEISMISI